MALNLSNEDLNAIKQCFGEKLAEILPNIMKDDEWVSSRRARQILGDISIPALLRLRKSGAIQSNYPIELCATGRHVMYKRTSLIEYIEKKAVKGKMVRINQ